MAGFDANASDFSNKYLCCFGNDVFCLLLVENKNQLDKFMVKPYCNCKIVFYKSFHKFNCVMDDVGNL